MYYVVQLLFVSDTFKKADILRRPQKFGSFSTYFHNMTLSWAKILWPSQNIWTLKRNMKYFWNCICTKLHIRILNSKQHLATMFLLQVLQSDHTLDKIPCTFRHSLSGSLKTPKFIHKFFAVHKCTSMIWHHNLVRPRSWRLLQFPASILILLTDSFYLVSRHM